MTTNFTGNEPVFNGIPSILRDTTGWSRFLQAINSSEYMRASFAQWAATPNAQLRYGGPVGEDHTNLEPGLNYTPPSTVNGQNPGNYITISNDFFIQYGAPSPAQVIKSQGDIIRVISHEISHGLRAIEVQEQSTSAWRDFHAIANPSEAQVNAHLNRLQDIQFADEARAYIDNRNALVAAGTSDVDIERALGTDEFRALNGYIVESTGLLDPNNLATMQAARNFTAAVDPSGFPGSTYSGYYASGNLSNLRSAYPNLALSGIRLNIPGLTPDRLVAAGFEGSVSLVNPENPNGSVQLQVGRTAGNLVGPVDVSITYNNANSTIVVRGSFNPANASPLVPGSNGLSLGSILVTRDGQTWLIPNAGAAGITSQNLRDFQAGNANALNGNAALTDPTDNLLIYTREDGQRYYVDPDGIAVDFTLPRITSTSRAPADARAAVAADLAQQENIVNPTASGSTTPRANSWEIVLMQFPQAAGIEQRDGAAVLVDQYGNALAGITVTDEGMQVSNAYVTARVNAVGNSFVTVEGTQSIYFERNAQGVLTATAITTPTGSTSETTERYTYNSAGQSTLQSSTTRQTYDDGSALETTTTPSGVTTVRSYDAPQDGADAVLAGTTTTTPSRDENNNPVPNTFDIITRDGAGNLVNVTTRQVNPIDGAYVDGTLTPPGSSAPAGTLPALSVTRTDAAGTTTPVHNTAAVGNLTGAATLFNDLYALYNAMSGPQTGNGLPIASGAVNLVVNTLPQGSVPALGTLGSGLGILNGLAGLDRAASTGSTGPGIIAAAGLTRDVASTVASGLGYTGYSSITTFLPDGTSFSSGPVSALQEAVADEAFGAASGVIGGVSSAVPYLSIAYQLEQGNYAGAVGQAFGLYLANVGAVVGPVGAVIGLVVGYVLGELFGPTPPPPWGSANAIWDPVLGRIRIVAEGASGGEAIAFNRLASLGYSNASGPPDAWGVANVSYGAGFENLNLQVNASGESFGTQRVQQTLQGVTNFMQARVDAINAQLLARGQGSGQPVQQLGIIAQRMPSLTWRASEFADRGFRNTTLATNSIAAYALIDWPSGVNRSQRQAENDAKWRLVA